MKGKTKKLIIFKLVLLALGGTFLMNTVIAQSSKNTATVYIMRKAKALVPPMRVSVNDNQIGILEKRRYFKCIVPAGNVKIKGEYMAGGVVFAAQESQLYVEPGKVSFIEYNPNQARFLSEEMDEYKGREILAKCTPQRVMDLINGIDLTTAKNTTDNVLEVPSQQTSLFSDEIEKRQSIRNSDVDVNVPISETRADNTFVLIIANENYEFVDDVQFAINDGEAMREYCIKTLGVPERQVWFYKNASAGIIAGGVDKMVQAMDIFDDAKAIVYYCGHGIPDEKTGDAYLVPTDGKGTNVATCYSLNKLYKTLSNSKASSVTYFMDACFTGANRDGSMLVAARGVAREAKKETIEGNTVVFSAASGDETAMPYKEKRHGLFTYFLLKKIQETKGNVNYGELADYIKANVKKEAFLTNEKPQNPVIATSTQVSDSWKTTKLK